MRACLGVPGFDVVRAAAWARSADHDYLHEAAPAIGVLRHGAPDRHHERDRGVDLLLRPWLGGVEVDAPATLAAPRPSDGARQPRRAPSFPERMPALPS